MPDDILSSTSRDAKEKHAMKRFRDSLLNTHTDWPDIGEPAPKEIRSGAVFPSRRGAERFRIEANTADGLEVYEGARRVGAEDVQAEPVSHRYLGDWATASSDKWLEAGKLYAQVLRVLEPLLAAPAASPEIESDETASLGRADGDSDYSTEYLSEILLDPAAADDWLESRDLVVLAEDRDFSSEQSKLLAPRLLALAIQHRDSDDPKDSPAVLSAIRTGASMLHPNNARRLLALLEPGHSIDTSLVALKMLGRIFEAQPPEKPDQYADLACEVRNIADLLLNPYAIGYSQSAAMAQLAIYALAAMASNETLEIVRAVRRVDVSWFTQQTAHELRELRSYWDGRSAPVAPDVLELLERATQELSTT